MDGLRNPLSESLQFPIFGVPLTLGVVTHYRPAVAIVYWTPKDLEGSLGIRRVPQGSRAYQKTFTNT